MCTALFWTKEEDKGPTEENPHDYGVDVSFPIHHELKPNLNSANPIKRMFARRYQEHIEGCYKKYSFRECDSNELVPSVIEREGSDSKRRKIDDEIRTKQHLEDSKPAHWRQEYLSPSTWVPQA